MENQDNHRKDIRLTFEDPVVGELNQFISNSQKNWRTIQLHQQYPYKMISKYFRNVQYKGQNTRTLQCLKATLDYIYQYHVPRIRQFLQHKFIQKPQKNNQLNQDSQREHFLSFIEQRLKAIKVQYFVQGIINPVQLLKLIRLRIFIDCLRCINITGDGIDLITSCVENGDEYQLDKQLLQDKFRKQYIEALGYGILLGSQKQLISLVQNNSIIFEEKQLEQLLTLRKKIDMNNYYSYFFALENHPNLIIRCILWNRIGEMRQIVKQRVIKCKMNVKSAWFNRIMGIYNETDNWIKFETLKQYFNDPKQYLKVGIKAWLNIDDVVQQLQLKGQIDRKVQAQQKVFEEGQNKEVINDPVVQQ